MADERIRKEIHAMVRKIPRGEVATYGHIAYFLGTCTARMVGEAMAALPEGTDVPWHRVLNSEGKISLPGAAGARQRRLLVAEGVRFDARGRVDFEEVGWMGPNWKK